MQHKHLIHQCTLFEIDLYYHVTFSSNMQWCEVDRVENMDLTKTNPTDLLNPQQTEEPFSNSIWLTDIVCYSAPVLQGTKRWQKQDPTGSFQQKINTFAKKTHIKDFFFLFNTMVPLKLFWPLLPPSLSLNIHHVDGGNASHYKLHMAELVRCVWYGEPRWEEAGRLRLLFSLPLSYEEDPNIIH